MSEPTYQDWADNLGNPITVTGSGGATTSLQLSGCTPLTSDTGFDSFTVTLVGGPDAPREQATYTLTLPGCDPADVFLVPVAAIADGIEFEAVFNQRKR